MSTALEEITEQALKLPRSDRLALANRLLIDDEEVDVSAVEAAWEEEILARIETIDNHTATGISYEDVIRAE